MPGFLLLEDSSRYLGNGVVRQWDIGVKRCSSKEKISINAVINKSEASSFYHVTNKPQSLKNWFKESIKVNGPTADGGQIFLADRPAEGWNKLLLSAVVLEPF